VTTPHFFLMRELEATAFKRWFAQAEKRATEKLTYTDLLVKVVATALRLHPRLNASWRDGAVVPHDEVNIALAVATPDGLVAPVNARANDLSLSGIARQRAEVVARAQAGKLRPDDLRGGTFTISNLGMYGVDAFTAIINSPQAAILAVGALVDRVIPVDGQPAVRPTITLTLSCDHRVVDGARGAQFLATVAELMTDPAGL
jgi:pyruvate dehydrogenase E2 component (dihydrolipoamide acetyltransferase)